MHRSRHVPLRRCAVCRASMTKPELIRLLRGEAGGWRVDVAQRLGGRGTWVCHACAARSGERETRRAYARAFRQQADEVMALLKGAPGIAGGLTPAGRPRQGGTHG